jgi:hypothetical protein
MINKQVAKVRDAQQFSGQSANELILMQKQSIDQSKTTNLCWNRASEPIGGKRTAPKVKWSVTEISK